MVCQLGLEEHLVAVSCQCQYLPAAKNKPQIVRFNSQKEDASGASPFVIDFELLEQLKPDVVIGQDLCDVCSASTLDALEGFGRSEKVRWVSHNPHSLQGIFDGFLEVAKACGVEAKGREILDRSLGSLEEISEITRKGVRKRVAALEWVNPFYNSGHWISEMVEKAGGIEVLGNPGKKSEQVDWSSLALSEPDSIILMPCGLNMEQAKAMLTALQREFSGNQPLIPVKEIILVDARFFVCPSLSVVSGIRLLSYLLHGAGCIADLGEDIYLHGQL
jgi:iron complex transport system substrate-binding protein